MNKPIVRAWIAILLFTAMAAVTTERVFDQLLPSIMLSCACFGTGVVIYHVRPSSKAAYIAPTFGALGCYFFMLAFRTSSVGVILMLVTIAAQFASVIMAIAGVPKGRAGSQ